VWLIVGGVRMSVVPDIKLYPDARHSFFNDRGNNCDKSAAEDSFRRVLGCFGQQIAQKVS
jgi:carboxymethylenebutenolidase